MTDKIYILTVGEYSDYRIRAVYDDKDTAKRVANNMNESVPHWHDSYRVEEYPINKPIGQYSEGQQTYEFTMDRYGAIVRFYAVDLDDLPDSTEYKLEITPSAVVMRVSGWFKSKNHAAKCANERRAQYIANGEWTAATAELHKQQEQQRKDDQKRKEDARKKAELDSQSAAAMQRYMVKNGIPLI